MKFKKQLPQYRKRYPHLSDEEIIEILTSHRSLGGKASGHKRRKNAKGIK
jgi:hypothetical protein